MAKWLNVTKEFHSFCKTLSVAADAQGMTQTDLATKVGTSQSVLSRAFSGKMKEEGVKRVNEEVWAALVACGSTLNVTAPTLTEYVSTRKPAARVQSVAPGSGKSDALLLILKMFKAGELTLDRTATLIRETVA